MSASIPQGPWSNPVLAEAVYDAEIVCLHEGAYGTKQDRYLQFVFWLSEEQVFWALTWCGAVWKRRTTW